MLAVARASNRCGVSLTAAATSSQLVPGYWRRVAADDPSADPCRIRLYLKSAEDGDRARQALHERAIQVGMDLVTLRFDTIAARGPQSNRQGGGRRAAGPPPGQ